MNCQEEMKRGIEYMVRKKLFIVMNNHFDLMWRRCFERRIKCDGLTLISYAELQEHYILENLKLCRQNEDYRFNIESVAVVRKFLENHPELFTDLKTLAENNRLFVPYTGDNIIDSNMVQGETIVRNYLYGNRWIRDNLGIKPKVAIRNDAFGNSAQLPQILRGFGIKWVTGLDYTQINKKYWRGLDGSTVYTENLPIIGNGGGWKKYAPCNECHGTGILNEGKCIICDGLGINRPNTDQSLDKIDLNPNMFDERNAGLVKIGGEESLPNTGILAWEKRNNVEYDIRFATMEEPYSYLKKWIDTVDMADTSDIFEKCELNPNNTGCYASRIKIKQNVRYCECKLMQLEALLTMQYLDSGIYPRKQIEVLWQKLLFTVFHDAITGTHVDEAYNELWDVFTELGNEIDLLYTRAFHHIIDNEMITIMNLTGNTATEHVRIFSKNQCKYFDEQNREVKQINIARTDMGYEYELFVKEIPPYSLRYLTTKVMASQVDIIKSEHWDDVIYQKDNRSILQGSVPEEQHSVDYLQKNSIENMKYLIEFNDYGLLSISDKTIDTVVSATEEYRPFEFILEHDEGSPWATLSADTNRIPLSRFTHVKSINKCAGYQSIEYHVKIDPCTSYSINALEIFYTITLLDESNRIYVKAVVNWDDYNHRIRIAVPITKNGRYFYEIPYGIIEREPYEPSFHWSGSNGDWPAINWAGIETDGFSVALFNKGTPSYKMESTQNGAQLLLTLLRSPSIPTYLHEPESYKMTKWDGMRDAGEHDFSFAFVSYASSFMESNIVGEANSFVNGLRVETGKQILPSLPTVISENARIASIKPAEDKNAIIMRLVEYRGKAGSIQIQMPGVFESVIHTDLNEREVRKITETDGRFEISVKPFEIITLQFNIHKYAMKQKNGKMK